MAIPLVSPRPHPSPTAADFPRPLPQRLQRYQLPDELILESGKLAELDRLLPRLQAEGSRVLLFSQFVIMLDVLEAYLTIRGHRYCRLDGQTAVTDR